MKNANNFFGNSAGSENFYRHSVAKKFTYTEGVRELVNKWEAYWLLDLIISHQVHEKVNKEEFQVWDLKRVGGNQFTIFATDGNHNKVARQNMIFNVKLKG